MYELQAVITRLCPGHLTPTIRRPATTSTRRADPTIRSTSPSSASSAGCAGSGASSRACAPRCSCCCCSRSRRCPASLVPQRSSDPNGVTQYFADNPDLAPFLDGSRLFDVYTSAWFSAIYLLLFVSLIGCVIPRTKHHFEALRAAAAAHAGAAVAAGRLHRARRAPSGETRPPRSTRAAPQLQAGRLPRRALRRLRGERIRLGRARLPARDRQPRLPHGPRRRARGRRLRRRLRLHRPARRRRGPDLRQHARAPTTRSTPGASSTTRLARPVHAHARRASTSIYETREPGRARAADRLHRARHRSSRGQGGDASERRSRSTSRSRIGGTDVYLLGNGYAPTITVHEPRRRRSSSPTRSRSCRRTPNLTSLGVVKVPDGLTEQLGMIGFFYPTQADSSSSARTTSSYPDLDVPGAHARTSTRATSASTTARRPRSTRSTPTTHDAAHRRRRPASTRSS